MATKPKTNRASVVSLFGGDPRVSHFTVSERYGDHTEYHRLTADARKMYDRDKTKAAIMYAEAREIEKQLKATRKEQSAKLKALGFKAPYFQYRNDDDAGKKAAKIKAEKFAADWEAKAGFELSVFEGCFL